MKKLLSVILTAALLFSLSSAVFAVNLTTSDGLSIEWTKAQEYTLADPAPWNLDELKQVVDVHDPRSVVSYFVWAVNRLVVDYDDGMGMMKYLFADLEPYGRGFTEGGMSGKAGWDTYMNERLKSDDYKWLPRAYLKGATADNGFKPSTPITVELKYNEPNTETLNEQSFESLGRLNIVYFVESNAAGNKVNIVVSRFDGSDRWYVTTGAASSAMFYDQRAALKDKAKTAATTLDDSTAADHQKKYGGASGEIAEIALPFTDVDSGAYYIEGINWAYNNKITAGTSETTFGPSDGCTRGQVVTFLWRAAGTPEPLALVNPFTDVSASDYYYKPILWAVENGITAGTSATTFAPNQTCSSAHIITFLYRAMDMGSDGWYEEAKAWASSIGLLDNTGIQVDPKENCPRGAVVTFLERAYE